MVENTFYSKLFCFGNLMNTTKSKVLVEIKPYSYSKNNKSKEMWLIPPKIKQEIACHGLVYLIRVARPVGDVKTSHWITSWITQPIGLLYVNTHTYSNYGFIENFEKLLCCVPLEYPTVSYIRWPILEYIVVFRQRIDLAGGFYRHIFAVVKGGPRERSNPNDLKVIFDASRGFDASLFFPVDVSKLNVVT